MRLLFSFVAMHIGTYLLNLIVSAVPVLGLMLNVGMIILLIKKDSRINLGRCQCKGHQQYYAFTDVSGVVFTVVSHIFYARYYLGL